MSVLCWVGLHKYVEKPRSFKGTGDKTLNWAGKIVNEYQSVEVCKHCGKSKTEKWIIYGE